MAHAYPLDLSFKVLSIHTRLSVADANGRLILYVRPKAFRLRESINVFADEQQSKLMFHMEADRIMDFSAAYQMTDASGAPVGSVKRQGMRSLWRAHYQIETAGQSGFLLHEENPWVKVIDGLVGEIPVLGLFSGYLLHPSYVVEDAAARPIMRIVKQPAFFQGKFRVEKLAGLEPRQEDAILLGLLMMILLERSRG
ncbi:MAG: hypothetical protein EHM61_17110 [Acidobacteria bacterium]|nr:MAG: hypothetical protein EHM61_17110 [Acidobacteriota bacterium]